MLSKHFQHPQVNFGEPIKDSALISHVRLSMANIVQVTTILASNLTGTLEVVVANLVLRLLQTYQRIRPQCGID